MDVTLPIAGLITEFNELLETGDFEGAEEILASALSGPAPQFAQFIHFQYGRLYVKWNKLTSAIHHLTKAAELAHAASDPLLLIQITEELKTAKKAQGKQRP
jgi:hypothetical protein